jgi:hypothetical protein
MSLIVFDKRGLTRALAASTTSASIAHPSPPDTHDSSVLVSNKSSAWATVVPGSGATAPTAVAATPGNDTDGVPVPPGCCIVVACPFGTKWLAAVLDSGTGNILFTPGRGD